MNKIPNDHPLVFVVHYLLIVAATGNMMFHRVAPEPWNKVGFLVAPLLFFAAAISGLYNIWPPDRPMGKKVASYFLLPGALFALASVIEHGLPTHPGHWAGMAYIFVAGGSLVLFLYYVTLRLGAWIKGRKSGTEAQ